jgi:hypothetical protein
MDPDATLEDSQVERRLGGGAGLTVTPVPRRARASRWALVRDTSTIVGTVLVAILAFQLSSGGGTVSSFGESIVPGQTGVAIGSLGLGETPGPRTTLGPIVNPGVHLDATPTPVPYQTLGPTTLTVVLRVTNDNGGNDRPSDWTVTVVGARPTAASFPGSSGGSTLVVDPGKMYSISTRPKTVGGYVQALTGECNGPTRLGRDVSCTITENDKPVSLTVTIVIKAGTDPSPPAPSTVVVTVTQSGVYQSTFAGSSTGTLVHLDSNHGYSVTTSPLADYVPSSSAGCSSTSGLPEGRAVTCTETFTYSPPPPTPTP